MDSLTQIVLGAATGEVILGRKIGNKAMLLGALGGTLPDLDILYNFFDSDPVNQLTFHRGYSHSVFTHLAVSFPLASLSRRLDRRKTPFGLWYLFWFACFFTHMLLDCCTTYGTKGLLPFSDCLVAFNNISVIDPLYTVPFLLLLAVCLFLKRDNPLRRNFLYAAIGVSSLYMAATFVLKAVVHDKFNKSLGAEGISFDELDTTPTILNAVLWSAIARNDQRIYTAEYSFLRSGDPIEWIGYDRNLSLADRYDGPALQSLVRFSDGNYFLKSYGPDTLGFFNIKWGRTRFDVTEPREAFIFYFLFYQGDEGMTYRQWDSGDWSFKEALEMLLRRIGV